jgi:hypothetical protein
MQLVNQYPITAEQIIVDIISQGMALPKDTIWVRDENHIIPPDKRLYIVVGMVDSQVLSNTNTVVPTDAGMTQKFTVQTVDRMQIDIFSASEEAMFRRWEVLAALTSVYSIQQQEKYNIQLAPIPRNFINTTSTEGGSRLKKFSIVVSASVWYYKETILDSTNGDYYNQFATRVDDEQTIGQTNGLIEFNIPS